MIILKRDIEKTKYIEANRRFRKRLHHLITGMNCTVTSNCDINNSQIESDESEKMTAMKKVLI